jgi:molybdenum cofactor cytidylyltransferase
MSEAADTGSIAAIILAAGDSSRLGHPKQLLLYNGQTLLKNTVMTAHDAGLRPVMVVLGSGLQQSRREVADQPVAVLENADWREGISSSIRMGVAGLPARVDAVLLLVCDQPFVSRELLQGMVDQYHTTGKPIVACEYSGTLGVPAIFGRSFFADLLALRGEGGAKKIITSNTASVAAVAFPRGAIDIDTLEQYRQLTEPGGRS